MKNHSLFAKNSIVDKVLGDFSAHDGWIECVVVVCCLLIAWEVHRRITKKINDEHTTHPLIFKLLDGVLPSFVTLVLLWVSELLANPYIRINLLDMMLFLTSLVFFLRLFFSLLYLSFKEAAWVGFLGRLASAFLWVVVFLYLTGHVGEIAKQLNSISFTYGTQKFTILTIIKLLIVTGFTLLITLSLSNIIIYKLHQNPALQPNVKTAVSSLIKVILVLLGIVFSLTALGIDLTVFSVIGGALGIGLGFGMQKVMSSYVSGFIILMDESVKIGDKITINGYTGQVLNITTRYTVIRGSNGTESIIPNETVLGSIVTTVLNSSSLSPKVLKVLTTQVGISYNADVNLAMKLMKQAAGQETVILANPAPLVYLKSFGEKSIILTLSFSVDDLTTVDDAVISKVNTSIFNLFRENKIEISPPELIQLVN